MTIDKTARAEAETGEHANWRAVRTKLVQLGYEQAPQWFEDMDVRCGIDMLCFAKRSRF